MGKLFNRQSSGVWNIKMKIRAGLIGAGMVMGGFFFADSSLACPKCFASTSHQVLNAYYVSIDFFVLIPAGIIGALALWISRQAQSQRNLDKFSVG